MKIKILQENPKVFEKNGSIFKEIESIEQANKEYLLLKKYQGDLIKGYDFKRYKLYLIKPISIKNKLINMEKASGERLDIILKKSIKDIEIIAGLMSLYHKNLKKHESDSLEILGDFAPKNIFISKENHKVTFIDPGGGFKTKNSFYIDIARFIFSMFQSVKMTPLESIRILSIFLNTYGNNLKMERSKLKVAINERHRISVKKFKIEKGFQNRLKSQTYLFYIRILIFLILKFKLK